MHLHHTPRRATSVVEFAVVAPVALLLIFGLLIGGMGVFRYLQVAALAREASRWASTHGTQYASETGNPAATADDVYQHVIAKQATAFDLSKLTCSVTWNTSNSAYHTIVVNGTLVPVTNTVTVTVTYQWKPEAFLGGITLSSTSVSIMYY